MSGLRSENDDEHNIPTSRGLAVKTSSLELHVHAHSRMINRSKGKVVLPIFESSAAGNSKLPQSTLPPRDDRIMRAFKQHPFPLLLISLVFVRLVVLLTSNKFAFVRTAFVTTHFHVMPTLFPKGDHSEGGLFTHVGLTVPTEYRGEGNGGCVWDVGANNGVWNSNR